MAHRFASLVALPVLASAKYGTWVTSINDIPTVPPNATIEVHYAERYLGACDGPVPKLEQRLQMYHSGILLEVLDAPAVAAGADDPPRPAPVPMKRRWKNRRPCLPTGLKTCSGPSDLLRLLCVLGRSFFGRSFFSRSFLGRRFFFRRGRCRLLLRCRGAREG